MLGEIGSFNYITDKGLVIEKMIVENEWVHPIEHNLGDETVTISQKDYDFAVAPYLIREQKLTKHLPNKHDQSTHGKGGSGIKPMSEEAKQSIRDWSQASYMDVSAYLRRHNSYSRAANPIKGKVVAEKMAEAFDATTPLSSPINTYRRVVGDFARKLQTAQVGDSWKDSGYVATSKSKTFVENLVAWDKTSGDFDSMILNIRSPKGIKAIDVNSLIGQHDRSNEEEILLDKNLTFTVTKISDSVIDVDVTNG